MSKVQLSVKDLMELRMSNPTEYARTLDILKSQTKQDKNMLDLYIAVASAEIKALQAEKQDAIVNVEPTVTYDYFERNGKKYPVCQFNNFGTRPFSLGQGKVGAIIKASESGVTLKDIQKTLKSM